MAAVALIFIQCRNAGRYLQSKRPKAETTPHIPQNYYVYFILAHCAEGRALGWLTASEVNTNVEDFPNTRYAIMEDTRSPVATLEHYKGIFFSW
jgi:hypothetical protein